MTLYDLTGKIENKSTVKIWGLKGEAPVPAIFCILEKEEEDMVIKQAKIAIEQNMYRYVKIKMFGDLDKDRRNISALRKFLGSDSFILGDPNRGYKYITDLDELSKIMISSTKLEWMGLKIPLISRKKN